MKSCEGYLICSDFDGTFFHKTIPQNNITAVNEFMARGGHFTFCTGRRGDVFKQICRDFKPNVPLIGMGGGQIYDIDNDRSLKQVFFGPELIPLVRDFMREYHGVRTIRLDFIDHSEYFMPDDTVLIKDYFTREVSYVKDRTPLSRLTFEECPPVYKVVVYLDFTNAESMPTQVKMLCSGRCNPIANDWKYIELMPFGFDKGTAALELKKMTGDHTLIAIGDFLGDIPLLKTADIGYAVENALPEVKRAADRLTVHVDQGAVDAIIRPLLE